jgi:quinol monooxygenase YgiN
METTMIHILARITAKPGSAETVSAVLLELARHTRQEAGCKLYTLVQREDEPTLFMTVEQWQDQASADAHLRTPHIAAALTQAGPHLAVPPEIHRYNALV